jgi:hypothetical protein
MLDKMPKKSIVEEAIKSQKWDRSSYEYALNAMLPHRCFNDSSIYKKSELIELFYKALPSGWGTIKSFTTFRYLN